MKKEIAEANIVCEPWNGWDAFQHSRCYIEKF